MKFSFPSLESLALKTLDDEVKRIREGMLVEDSRIAGSVSSKFQSFEDFAASPECHSRTMSPNTNSAPIPDSFHSSFEPMSESRVQKRPLAMLGLAFFTGVLMGLRSVREP
jgi:hypothetical protein